MATYNDTIILIHPSNEDSTAREFEINTNGVDSSSTNLNVNPDSQQIRPQNCISFLRRMWNNRNNIPDDRINSIIRRRESSGSFLTLSTSETERTWRPISRGIQSIVFRRWSFATGDWITNSEPIDSQNSTVEPSQIAINHENFSNQSSVRNETHTSSGDGTSSNPIRLDFNPSLSNGVPNPQSFPENRGNTASDGHRNHAESHQDIYSSTISAAEYLPECIGYLTFLAIFLLKPLVDHWMCILRVFLLHLVTFGFNYTLSTYVAKLTRRRFFGLCLDLFIMMKLISYCFIIFKQTPDYLGLIMYPVSETTFFGLLHAIVLNDIGLKLVTMLIKMSLTLFFAKLLKHKVMGRLFALIEGMSQMYRSIAPIRTWLQYIFPPSYTGWKVIAGILLSSFYISAKFYECVVRARLLKNKFCSFIRNADFDKPTAKQLQDNCNMCAICRETYTAPLILKCKHIFCEACITTWFERKNNCPICRRKVKQSFTWHNGRTSLLYQIF